MQRFPQYESAKQSVHRLAAGKALRGDNLSDIEGDAVGSAGKAGLAYAPEVRVDEPGVHLSQSRRDQAMVPLMVDDMHRHEARAPPPSMRAYEHRGQLLRSFPRAVAAVLRAPMLSSVMAMAAAALFSLLMVGIVAQVRWLQDPDKALAPWRKHCAMQPSFLREDADRLAPVSLLVGVLTTADKFERRQVIRSTYASMTMPRSANGVPLGHIQVKFVLGRPRKELAERVALEMEMYNDIVILNMKETQWSRKTYEFLRWASENATVPVLVPRRTPTVHGVAGAEGVEYEPRWKLADYVLKADDDAFIVLDELERRLRVLPRERLHWGYRINDDFMSGETYALSQDLVQFIAHAPEIARWPSLKEDVQVARWLRLHPQSAELTWASERCWIYDHPRAPTPYAHGFLFPDHVEEIRREMTTGLSPAELARRGGMPKALSYSTTTQWGRAYHTPKEGLSVEESIEALVEGGGRWAGHWSRSGDDPDTPRQYARDELVWAPDDARLSPASDTTVPWLAQQTTVDAHTGLLVWNESVSTLHEARPPPLLPEPWGPGLDAYAARLRQKRYLNDTTGGTVVVHYLKREAWFYETALALVGRARTWQHGNGANRWRMYNSPVVQAYSSTHAMIA